MPSRGVIEGGIGFRRNGKEKACEPCRKGKLACDHSVPVCSRCIRRKITSKCVYHPAPMTKARESQASTSSSLGEPIPSLSPSTIIQGKSPAQRLHSNSLPSKSGHNLNQDPGIPKGSDARPSIDTDTGERIVNSSPSYTWNHDAKPRRPARYYGPTSFSAVFTEGVELSADMDICEDPRKHPAQWYAKLTSHQPHHLQPRLLTSSIGPLVNHF